MREDARLVQLPWTHVYRVRDAGSERFRFFGKHPSPNIDSEIYERIRDSLQKYISVTEGQLLSAVSIGARQTHGLSALLRCQIFARQQTHAHGSQTGKHSFRRFGLRQYI